MKNAKLAVIVALALILLRTVLCIVVIVFGAISLSNETNRVAAEPANLQGSVPQYLQATLQQVHAELHQQSIHRDQTALYWDIFGLAWNLVLAGLLIFAIRRLQISK